MKYLKKLVPIIFFRIEYIIEAYLKHFCLIIKGSNFIKRTRDRKSINVLKEKLEENPKKRLAIFVAFHSSNELPISNLNYLDILRKCSFNTIYVHNGNLKKRVMNKLNNLGCFVICRENVGQDFGAWRDTILLINKYKLLNNLNWLLLCNDSNFCLGGKNQKLFIDKFSNMLDLSKGVDFIALNANFEKKLHYQSYFLCLSKEIFNSTRFINFWKKYVPLNHRFHAIESGEKKFTANVLNYYKQKIIFSSQEIHNNIILKEDITCEDFLKLLPKIMFYFEACFNYSTPSTKNNRSTRLRSSIRRVVNSLENFNPSHVYALINIVFLNSPFLKKDVIRQGVFSLNQISETLQDLDLEEKLTSEIMRVLVRGGTPVSLLEQPKLFYRKGISCEGGAPSRYYHLEAKAWKNKFYNS